MQVLPRKTGFKVASSLPGECFAEAALPPVHGETSDPVVVVGGGPSGFRAAEELTKHGLEVVLFNGERWRPYRSVGSWYMWRAVGIANGTEMPIVDSP